MGKVGESEADQKIHDLGATIDHERIDREHEDTVLRTQLSGLRQEMDGEKAERIADLTASKRQLSSLDAQLTQQIRELRHNLDAEQSDRFAMCERMERSCSDLQITVESTKAAEDAITKELERVVRLNSQAVEAEAKERINMFDEYNRSTSEIRTSWSALRNELADEKDERIEDISVLRAMMENFDQKVNDYKTTNENEMTERIHSNEVLEKRLNELRKAVLVTINGPGAK